MYSKGTSGGGTVAVNVRPGARADIDRFVERREVACELRMAALPVASVA
jgi:hypothetical protein